MTESIHGKANSCEAIHLASPSGRGGRRSLTERVLPALKGDSPVRGNVCEADKRVPVSGGKGGFCVAKDGRVILSHFYASIKFLRGLTPQSLRTAPLSGEPSNNTNAAHSRVYGVIFLLVNILIREKEYEYRMGIKYALESVKTDLDSFTDARLPAILGCLLYAE